MCVNNMNLTQLSLYYVTELYVLFSILYCYSKISGNELNIKKSIYVIIIFSFFMVVNNIYNLDSFKFLMSFCIMSMSNYLCFKNNIKDTLFNTVIYILITTIFEFVFAPIFLSSFSNIEMLNNNGTVLKIVYTIFIFTISNVFFSFKRVIKLFDILKTVVKKAFSIEILLILIMIIFNLLEYVYVSKINNLPFLFSVIISIIYVISTFIIIVNNRRNIEKLKLKNIVLEKSYKSYTKSLEEFRELKHNLKNKLFGIKSYLPQEEQKMLNEIIISYNKQCDWINNIENLPQGIEGIIYLKKFEAENKNISLIINYESKLKIKDKDYLDLCDVLGILLDNAIEATHGRKKVILLDAYDKDNVLIIKITNKFSNYVYLNKIFERNYSTKKIKSGIGLNYVKNLNNKHIKVNIKIINNLFNVYLYYKK